MPKKKKLYIVRKEFDGYGGAENVAKRYLAGFENFFNTHLIYAGSELEGHKFPGQSGRVGTGPYLSHHLLISFFQAEPNH